MGTLCKKLVWVALILVLGAYVSAQEKASKKITKTYALTNAGELQLENKYGTINLYGWNKDEVSVVIDVVVSHRKKENADDLLKRIRTVIRNNDNYIFVSYEIGEKSSGFFAKLFDEVHLDFDRSNIQIDYTIYMPTKAELTVKNTFGDVVIEDWTGKLKADVEHGDLWINDDLGRVDIDVRYGRLRARSIDYGTIDLKNGGFDMESGKNLKVTSSGSNIDINKVTSLELYSSKDEIVLEEVGTLFGNLKFTTVRLNRLTKDVDLTMRVADFRIANISNPDADIAIEQESSEINLNILNFPHRFDATLEQGLVRLPKTYENVDSKMLDEGKRMREIQATYGNNPGGKVSITGKKGVVLLKEL